MWTFLEDLQRKLPRRNSKMPKHPLTWSFGCKEQAATLRWSLSRWILTYYPMEKAHFSQYNIFCHCPTFKIINQRYDVDRRDICEVFSFGSSPSPQWPYMMPRLNTVYTVKLNLNPVCRLICQILFLVAGWFMRTVSRLIDLWSVGFHQSILQPMILDHL